VRGIRSNGYWGSRTDLYILGLCRRTSELALDWYERRLHGFSWRRVASSLVCACAGSIRVDSTQPAGLDIHVSISMQDTGEVVVSKIEAEKSLQAQLNDLAELIKLCNVNGWELEAWQ
jgi:hypothetical protein